MHSSYAVCGIPGHICMFLDTNGKYGGRRDDDEPPFKRPPERELPWMLIFCVLTIFFGTISFGAHMTDQDLTRDSCSALAAMSGIGALIIFVRHVFEWYNKKLPYRK
jgi:hypothetical protein